MLEGYFVNGVIHGKTREISDTEWYIGNTSKGKRHGFGVSVDEYDSKEETKYEGEWDDGY